MSINGAMLSGVSALTATSSALGAISDNIANVNTVGFKQKEVEFSDLVSAQAPTGKYNSGGVQADIGQIVSQQGQFQQTSTSTDMAINGNGMFVVAATSKGITNTSGPSFTRAGSFTSDASGNLVNASGYYLQGWAASSTGVVTVNPSNLGSLSTININNVSNAPDPSTTASLSANLNADLYTAGTASAAATGGTYSATSATTSMAAYDNSGGTTGTKPDYTTQMTIYDAQGGAHSVNLDFLKTTTANTWDVEINANPAGSVTSTNGTLASGTVTFNSDGSFKSTSMVTGATASTQAAGAVALSVPWAAASGLGTQALTLNLNSTTGGGLTQYADASATNSNTVDGGPTSPVAGIKITTAGLVQATFENGNVKTLAQVALATFNNYNGLTATSGDAFIQSADSGSFVLQAPQQGQAGAIQASTLESSTVDLSAEFTNLITTQNAYSAASKIISTADNMETTLDQLIPG